MPRWVSADFRAIAPRIRASHLRRAATRCCQQAVLAETALSVLPQQTFKPHTHRGSLRGAGVTRGLSRCSRVRIRIHRYRETRLRALIDREITIIPACSTSTSGRGSFGSCVRFGHGREGFAHDQSPDRARHFARGPKRIWSDSRFATARGSVSRHGLCGRSRRRRCGSWQRVSVRHARRAPPHARRRRPWRE